MKNRQLHRLAYHIRQYFTLNNIVIGLAAMVAIGWVWGSLGSMQQNYDLQRKLHYKEQAFQLAKLEARNLELEAAYHRTEEYQELAVRERLGRGQPGERVIIVPARPVSMENPPAAIAAASEVRPLPNNPTQWFDFFFGSPTTE